jgi:hypothetical protein
MGKRHNIALFALLLQTNVYVNRDTNEYKIRLARQFVACGF